ncbi:MAG: hypothetical protein ACKPEY_10900 [Planctomycetota bacterium]
MKRLFSAMNGEHHGTRRRWLRTSLETASLATMSLATAPLSLATASFGTLTSAWGLPLLGRSRCAEAATRWHDERQMQGLVCHADFSLDLETEALEAVGELPAALQRQLRLPGEHDDIHVFLFARQKTYQQYLQAYFPRLPQRPAHYVRERGPGMILAVRGPQLATDLRHEFTHALLNDGHSSLPLWLDEGLAEYFELPADDRALKNPYFGPCRQAAQRGRRLPTLEELEAWQEPRQLQGDDYRHAWSWVHFLLHGPPAAQAELIRYLHACRRRPAAVAIAAAPPSWAPELRTRWPDLDHEFRRHWQRMV